MGREDDNDIVIDDGRVSGQHGFLFLFEDRTTFVDGSSNGSKVDGKVVHGDRAHLRHGSWIQVGETRLVLLIVPPESLEGME